MNSPFIMDLFGSLTIDGYDIKTRRKKRILPASRNYGLCMGKKSRLFYNLDERCMSIEMYGEHPPTPQQLASSFHMIYPIDEERDEDHIFTSSLCGKIILGSCAWLWGDSFSTSKASEKLRSIIWNTKIDTTIKMDSNDHHFTLVDSKDSISSDEQNVQSALFPFKYSEKEIDAFNNKPNHTVVLMATKELGLVGMVNLFGYFESMVFTCEHDIEPFLNTTGMKIIIAHTTENIIETYDLNDYLKYKSTATGKSLSIREIEQL